jgi:hypothetical protein
MKIRVYGLHLEYWWQPFGRWHVGKIFIPCSNEILCHSSKPLGYQTSMQCKTLTVAIIWEKFLLLTGVDYKYENITSHHIVCSVLTHPNILCILKCNMTLLCCRYLFFMDVKDIRNTVKICVKQCPDRNLVNFTNIQEFYQRTGSLLCT